jgi:mono/diheme cytochrome c family protein
MWLNGLILLALVALIVLFGWLAWRAWHASRAWVKWVGGPLSSLPGLLWVAVFALMMVGLYRMNKAPYSYSLANVQAKMMPDQIAAGERYAHICTECHSSRDSLPLDGGQENFLADTPMGGVLYAPNLTPGGPLKDWTDGEILRAIREGVDKDGRPLVIMPSSIFHNLSDADALALVAYLRSQPAVDRPLPKRNLSPLAAIFIAMDSSIVSAQAPIVAPITTPPPGTLAYGEYLVSSSGCRECHGADLSGMVGDNSLPPGPNLTVLVPKWSEQDFLAVFNTGLDPQGKAISADMPWKSYRQMYTDEQLKDLYHYLHELAPLASPQ